MSPAHVNIAGSRVYIADTLVYNAGTRVCGKPELGSAKKF
jgi:hypothetical protein